ncbi:MAG: hypothetical protein ACLGXA_16820 [Acidobacteriota bacterium]
MGEWTRLTRLYAEKSDEELFALAEDFGDLTEIAQGVLRDEMRKRRLEAPIAGGAANGRANEQRPDNARFGGWSETRSIGDVDPDHERAEDVEKVYLCECEGPEQVRQLTAALQAAGIDAAAEGIPFRPIAAFETVRILVPLDQLERAREIASRPIPKEITDALKRPAEDFEVPACPECGAEDPLLESVDPANSWHCETCGARWTDALPVENERQN